MTRTLRTVAVALIIALGSAMEAAAITTTLSPDHQLYDPANAVANYGVNLNGVSKLLIGTTTEGTQGCTGTLLSSRMHILTAAHCVTNDAGALNVTSVNASFFIDGAFSAPVAGVVSGISVAPGWTGVVNLGNDIALVTLSALAPTTGYSLFRDANVVGAGPVVMAGFGRGGTGLTGYDAANPFGTLRVGLNSYDTVWKNLSTGDIYEFAYDFDDGTALNDTLGNVALSPHLGYGNAEVMTIYGDSGGPTFFGGQIIGVHSFVTRSYGDSNAARTSGPGPADGSFEEVGADTRVAAWASWIDGIVAVPYPGSFVLVVTALGALAMRRRRARGGWCALRDSNSRPSDS